MRLTDRDLKLLSALQSYGCLTTRQLANKVFKDVRITTVLRRFRVLEKEKLIQRMRGLDSGEHLWAITEKAHSRHLSGPAKCHFPKFILEHDAALSRLRLQLEENRIAQSWTPEHEIRAQTARGMNLKDLWREVISDGIMGIEVNGEKKLVAIEIELSAKNQRRYEHILTHYSLKKNIWALWYICQNTSIMNEILKARRYTPRQPQLLFSSLSAVFAHGPRAAVHRGDDALALSQVFPQKMISPAQDLAHAMGGQVSTLIEKQNDVSDLNDDQTLAPTG